MLKKKLSVILAIPLALGILGGQAPKASAAYASISCYRLGDFLYVSGSIFEPVSFIVSYNYRVSFSDGPSQSNGGFTFRTNYISVPPFRNPNLKSRAFGAQLSGTIVSTRGLGFVSGYAGCPCTFR